MEDFSMFLSETLNNIGLSNEIVRVRRDFWRESAKFLNKDEHQNFHLVIAGSKSEGITSFCESDMDFMHVQRNVVCVDNAELLQPMPGIPQFKTDMSETPPGYAKLKLLNARQLRRNRTPYPPHIQASLFMEESGDLFASSAFLIADWRQCMCSTSCRQGINGTIHPTSGPAFPVSNDYVMIDNVHALPGICPTVFHEFRTRKRHNSWPSVELIQGESSAAVCQLVPVGCKCSDNQWKEWRFCFIETEMKLTHSLNDTQLKMYVLLKMIKNDILKHVSMEISSYIMKNVTYWISEMYGSHVFREENLVSMVLICLRFLKLAIDNYNLPYFMIPARNLLAERLEPKTRRQLRDVISELLQEGPRLFLRCPKVRLGMVVLYMSPRTILNYRDIKERVETLFLASVLVSNCKKSGFYDGDADKVLRQTWRDIVLPEWRIMSRLGLNYMPILYKRLKNLLS